MKRNALLLVFCLLLTGLTIQACKKGGWYKPIDNSIVANFSYKPGSYWIYKDSISGRIDSFFVTANSGITSTTFNDITMQQIKIDMQEDNINNMAKDTTTWYWILSDNYIYLKWWDDTYKDVSAEYGIFVTYPFKKGISISNNGLIKADSSSSVVNIDSQYVLSGIIYINVAEIFQTYNGIDSLQYYDWFCFNADAGIIKMRLDHSHFSFKRVWELQRYHIVK